MKCLLTISTMLVSSLAMGQWPNLPYNPDDNADGLIGVVDLQGLLANYGNEFASAVISEDGESAIVALGQMQYPVCAFACKSLPGFWDIPTLEEFGMIWDEIGSEVNSNNFSDRYYVRPSNPDGNTSSYDVKVFSRYQSGYGLGNFSMSGDNVELQCYCAAKQLPRVEYSACEGSNIQECCSSKVAEGWYPLGNPSSAPQNNSPYYRWNQAFWRWA